MNLPRRGGANSGTSIHIEDIYRQSTEPETKDKGTLWIDTSSDIPRIYYYNGESWIEASELETNVWINENEPTTKYNGLIWFKLAQNQDNSYKITSVYVYANNQWLPITDEKIWIELSQNEPEDKFKGKLWIQQDENGNVAGVKVYDGSEWKNVSTSSSNSGSSVDTYQVKASSTDTEPGFLDKKVDNTTITVSNNKLKVKFQDDKSKNVVWSSQRVTKEAIIKAIIFG